MLEQKEIYRVGWSFRNPRGIMYPSKFVGPERIKSLWAPEGVKIDKRLRTRKPLWFRRVAKANSRAKLGLVGNSEVPSFQGLALGQITVDKAPTTTRTFWGSLTNILTTGADIWAKREETRLKKIEAEIKAREAVIMPSTVTEWSTPILLGVGGIALVGAYVLYQRR